MSGMPGRRLGPGTDSRAAVMMMHALPAGSELGRIKMMKRSFGPRLL